LPMRVDRITGQLEKHHIGITELRRVGAAIRGSAKPCVKATRLKTGLADCYEANL